LTLRDTAATLFPGSIVRRLLVLLLLALAVAALAAPGSQAWFTKRGTVVNVVDGDTLDVRMRSGERERIRLVGIDTPEVGDCYADRATRRARALAARKQVVLQGDRTQSIRDRYGRLLAYVDLPGAVDLGRRLVLGGFAKVYVYDRPFRRLAGYRRAESAAKRLRRGLWAGCASPAPASGGRGCHTSYSPCLPVVADLDCGEISDSKKPIRVLGSDPYRLDADDDGWGCE
jgi:endonuclease YncB( thermonuclease family)